MTTKTVSIPVFKNKNNLFRHRKLHVALSMLLGLAALLAAACSGDDPGADPSLTPSVTALTVPAVGGDLSFTVDANTDWTVTSNAAWLTATKASATKVNVHADANENGAERTATIMCIAGSLNVKINVTQGLPTAAQSDSLALVALYDATSGYNWTAPRWDLSKPLSQWSGVKVEAGRVVELNVASRNLNGTVPVAIGNLSKLEYCDLGKNNLSGAIPASINNLTELAYLDLMENHFTGTIPSLSGLVKLSVLDVSDNAFTAGAVPAFVSALPALEMLMMRHAGLTGALPATLPANLHTLDLSFNALAGAIPDTWSALTKLEVLYLYANNSLNGAIPSFEGFDKLTSLALDGNKFTGTVPVYFINLALLKDVWLQYNNLSGTIDDALLADPRWSKWHVCAGNNFTNCAGDSPETVAGAASKAAPLKALPYPSKTKYQRK